jgi:hypothetical protein
MLTSNFPKFLKDIKKDLKKLEIDKKDIIKEITVFALESLQETSPVDTGRYKSSHIPSLGSSSPDMSPEGRTRNYYIRLSQERLEEVKRLLQNKIMKKICITNNLPYASVIEHGGPNRFPHKVYAKVRSMVEAELTRLIRKKTR